MRIIFVGSVVFSAKALEKLIAINADIAGVVAKKDSAFNSDFFDLGTIAANHGIPFRYVTNINNPDSLDWIRQQNPDVIFCFGWSNLIKKELLELPKLGVVGFHPSLLPDNKGRHPLIWAKVLGLEKTGSTFFFMDEGADTGDIISQKEIAVDFNDDAGILYEKMTNTALAQVEVFHEALKNNTYERIIQDKNAGNNWRKRSMRDGAIDFRMNTINICNLVRALTHPYVGAHIDFNTVAVTVWKIEPGLQDKTLNNIEPGKILTVLDNRVEVKTGDGSVWLTDHEFSELPQVGSYL